MNQVCSYYRLNLPWKKWQLKESVEKRNILYSDFLNLVLKDSIDTAVWGVNGFVSWHKDFGSATDIANTVQKHFVEKDSPAQIGISINKDCAELASDTAELIPVVWDMDYIIENIYPKHITWIKGFGPRTAEKIGERVGKEASEVTIKDYVEIPFWEVQYKITRNRMQTQMHASLRNNFGLSQDIARYFSGYTFMKKEDTIQSPTGQISMF